MITAHLFTLLVMNWMYHYPPKTLSGIRLLFRLWEIVDVSDIKAAVGTQQET